MSAIYNEILSDQSAVQLDRDITGFASWVSGGEEPFTANEIILVGKGLWRRYNELSIRDNSYTLGTFLTKAAAKILETTIQLVDAFALDSTPEERTDLLVSFVIDTGLRGMILVLENRNVMQLAALAPLRELLRAKAESAGRDLDAYLGDHSSSHWFSTQYDPLTESFVQLSLYDTT